jgi:(p)ppGpp synthase/HD superfamily hydrolase
MPAVAPTQEFGPAMSNHASWTKGGRRILGSIADERAAKINSFRADPASLLASFDRELKLNGDDLAYVHRCVEFAAGVQYTKSSLGTAYLSHPLRVAQYVVRAKQEIRREYMAIALLHNVPETSAVTLDEIAGELGQQVADGIGVLVVDRSVRFETIIESYYARLFAAGDDLVLVKLFDKFDNLLVLNSNPDAEVRRRYIAEIRIKLLPWCGTFDSGLAKYVAELLFETEERGFDAELGALMKEIKSKTA